MKKPFIKYITSMLLFGLNGIVASNIALSSYEIVLTRTLLGSLMLAALFLISRQRVTLFQNKTDAFYIALSGISMGMSWMFLYEAYARLGVGMSTMIYYSGSVAVMVLSPLIFGEKLTVSKICGFVIALMGVLLMNYNPQSGQGSIFGVFCGVMSAVTYASMVICNKKSKNVQGLENSLLQLIVGFVTVLVFFLFKNGMHLKIAAPDWKWILTLGLINTGIGCYLYFSSIGKLPAQSVVLCGFLEPLSALVFSFAFLSEKMLTHQIISCVLILLGAFLGELDKLRRKAVS